MNKGHVELFRPIDASWADRSSAIPKRDRRKNKLMPLLPHSKTLKIIHFLLADLKRNAGEMFGLANNSEARSPM